MLLETHNRVSGTGIRGSDNYQRDSEPAQNPGSPSLWITELSASNEKLDKLQAAAMMRDSTLLIETILQMTGQEKIKIELKTQKLTDNNQYTRYKRNILGDFLSAVTGVATEDELQKQMKIDNEIRDKVVEVLGRQVTFEKSITAYYTNLTREEEQMHKRIDAIANQRTRDRNQLSRIMVLTAIAQDDIKDMEDILEILWTGRVPARHAIKLSKYAKLPRVALFNFNRATPGQEGPVMQYSTRTYYNSKAKVIEYGLTYTEIQTDHNLYHTTINQCTRGRGLERPGDVMAALFLQVDFGRFFGWGVG